MVCSFQFPQPFFRAFSRFIKRDLGVLVYWPGTHFWPQGILLIGGRARHSETLDLIGKQKRALVNIGRVVAERMRTAKIARIAKRFTGT